MSEIILHEPLASQIRREAEARGIAVESLIESAFRHYRFQAQRDKINAESAWWRSVSPEYRAQYAGEYVAVHNQAVVDHDHNEETLRKRVRVKYGKTAVLVTPAEGRPTLRIVSTRLTQL